VAGFELLWGPGKEKGKFPSLEQDEGGLPGGRVSWVAFELGWAEVREGVWAAKASQ
jgi:hypothetical protein